MHAKAVATNFTVFIIRSNRNTTAVEILCTVHGLRFGHLKLIDKMVNQGFKTQQ